MALIKCPECGKEVSDRAEKCIHCGYPLENTIGVKGINYNCVISGTEFNLQKILQLIQIGQYKQSFVELHKITGSIMSCGNEINLIEYIKMYDEIPKEYGIRDFTAKEEQELATEILKMKDEIKVDSKTNQVKCPKCGSTQIQMLPRKWSFMTGFLTNKVDRVCVNCKYKF